MPDLSYLSRWAYEEAYSLLRLHRHLLDCLSSDDDELYGVHRSALHLCQDRLSDLRSVEWDAVALAERSLAFARKPYMETRCWRVYDGLGLRRSNKDKNPYFYEWKGGGVYFIPDSLFPF